jgi:hypothetical protein
VAGRIILPPPRRRRVYFDTSAWDAIQREGGLESPSAKAIERAIVERRLWVVTGEMTFDETLPLYLVNELRAIARLDLIGRLADLRQTVRHASDLTREAVMAALTGTAPPSPFTDRYADLDGLLEALRESGRDGIERYRAPNVEKDEQSKALMLEAKTIVQAALKERGGPTLTLERFIEKEPFHNLIKYYFGEGPALPEAVSKKLSRSRALQMFTDGLASMLFGQMIENWGPEDSDLRDLHHAVAATFTNGLVTSDRSFRGWCRRVGLPDFEVYSVQELIDGPTRSSDDADSKT